MPAALLAAGGGGPLLAWRIDSLAHASTCLSGIGAERFGGRWNPKGQRAVYCSLDPATCLVEAAVHRGFAALDTQPHVLSCLRIDPSGLLVLMPDDLPNPAWLHGGVPSAGQQRFGAERLALHGVLVLPSAVSKPSWNLLIAPGPAAGRFELLHQQRLVVDVRLNPAPA